MLRLSVAFMQCFTAQSLRYAQLPLLYSAPDENGKITVTCTSVLISSESEGVQNAVITFYFDEVFLPAVQKIESWATERNLYLENVKRAISTLQNQVLIIQIIILILPRECLIYFQKDGSVKLASLTRIPLLQIFCR